MRFAGVLCCWLSVVLHAVRACFMVESGAYLGAFANNANKKQRWSALTDSRRKLQKLQSDPSQIRAARLAATSELPRRALPRYPCEICPYQDCLLLGVEILLESDPLKSRILVRRLATRLQIWARLSRSDLLETCREGLFGCRATIAHRRRGQGLRQAYPTKCVGTDG